MPRFNNNGARRHNNGGQSSSRRNAGETSGARSATTTSFSDSRGDDSAHLETVQAFHKEGLANKLSDISESCSLGEIMTWCRWFERRLEKLGTPGSIILSRMFAEAMPYDELVKQKSLIKMLIDDMGALAQRLEQRHVQSGDTSIMPQFQIGRKINEEVKSILEEIHSGGQRSCRNRTLLPANIFQRRPIAGRP